MNQRCACQQCCNSYVGRVKLSGAATLVVPTKHPSRSKGRDEAIATEHLLQICPCALGDRSACLKILQDRKAGRSCGKVLERMSAHDGSHRINRMVIKLEQLRQHIKRCNDKPIRCS